MNKKLLYFLLCLGNIGILIIGFMTNNVILSVTALVCALVLKNGIDKLTTEKTN